MTGAPRWHEYCSMRCGIGGARRKRDMQTWRVGEVGFVGFAVVLNGADAPADGHPDDEVERLMSSFQRVVILAAWVTIWFIAG